MSVVECMARTLTRGVKVMDDPAGMPLEGAHALARGEVPEPESAVAGR
jgi:hypothetical protein